MKKVAICIASYGDMKMLSVVSLVLSTNYLRLMGYEMTLHVRMGPYTHWNREQLVEDVLGTEDPEYVMFIDTDMTFPTDGIATLIEREKDVIGGMYDMKQAEPVSTIKLWNDDKTEFKPVFRLERPSEPFEVGALGTGFMLIDVRVFRGMEPPYFPCDYKHGEDVAFCLNAQKAGFEVWCDPTIALGHLGTKTF